MRGLAQLLGSEVVLGFGANAGDVSRGRRGHVCRIQADEHACGSKLVLLSGPTDGDGCCELVVGYTDRVVRAFRWEDLGEGTEHPTGQLVSLKKWTLEGQVRG